MKKPESQIPDTREEWLDECLKMLQSQVLMQISYGARPEENSGVEVVVAHALDGTPLRALEWLNEWFDRMINKWDGGNMKKTTLVGANPFIQYTGSQSVTALNVIGRNLSQAEAKKLAKEKYEDCGGLIIGVNQDTGEEIGLDKLL